MVVFRELTKQQAADYLETFLGVMQDRLDLLRERSAANGGPSPEVLDGSVESLGPLWEWALGQVSWRAGYRPVPPGEPPPPIDLTTVEPATQLPEFYEDWPQSWAQFTGSTLWLMDGLGRYVGEVLCRSLPKARWRVGSSRVKGYIHQNRPVVGPIPAGDVFEPNGFAFALVRRHLAGDPSTSALDAVRGYLGP